MALGDDEPLSIIMADLRSRLDARVQAARDAAARLRHLAGQYAAAVQADTDAELARRQGRDAPPPHPSPAQLAAALSEVVAGLPDFEDAGEREPPAPPRTPAHSRGGAVSFRDLISAHEPPLAERAQSAPPAPAHPLVLGLVHDLHSYDLLKLPATLFRATVEELAARGRELQERGVGDPDDSLRHVFRVLTRCAYDRKIPNLFGLDHKHQGNWTERAAAARERRLQLETAAPRPRPAAPPAKVEDDDSLEREPEEPWQLPCLARAAARRPVILVGGTRKPEKLDRLRQRLGFELEWISTSTSGMGSTGALERRVREGHVAAVVVLEGLISHKHSEQIVAAARHASVPLAYGGTAGIGALKRAFEKIEIALP